SRGGASSPSPGRAARQHRAGRPARARVQARHETSAAASRPRPGPAPTALLPSPSRVPPCRSLGCLATPIVSGREDVSPTATPPLPQDPGNYTSSYSYNSDGELTSTTVSQTGDGITARTTSYSYDGDGNRTAVTNPRNKTTGYSYTADDQLTLVTDPDSQSTLSCYDGDGNLTETVPPVGVAANSLTPASCPSSYPTGYGNRLASDATTYAYDALGDKTTITTPAPAGLSGSETTTNAYDAGGRLTSTTAPPTSTGTGAPSQVTAYSYDAADELLTKTAGSGTSSASTTSYCYDPNGNKTATVAPDGNTGSVAACATSSPWQTSSSYQTGYSYDSLGELVSKITPTTSFATSPTTSYSYPDPAVVEE